MIRNIAASLIAVGLLGTAVLAEDQDRSTSSSSSSQQDRSSSTATGGQQSDQSGAAGSSRDRSGSSRTGAAQTYDQAQTASGRTEADKPETDPTKAFIKDASMSNIFEIQAGHLAAKRVQDDQIKQFAQQMVQDHTQAQQQLKQVAQAAGVQLHDQLDMLHQAKLQKLQQCTSSDFQRKYINGQAAGHMMNVLEFRYQSQNAQNDQVKQLASQMLPKLEQHLKHATDLANQQAGGSSGEARTASERERSDSTTGTRSGSDTGTGARTGKTGDSSSSSSSSSSSDKDATSPQSNK
jgi:putative membrane protein